MGWAGSKVSVDAGLKQLKVIGRGKDRGWKQVPVSESFGINDLA